MRKSYLLITLYPILSKLDMILNPSISHGKLSNLTWPKPQTLKCKHTTFKKRQQMDNNNSWLTQKQNKLDNTITYDLNMKHIVKETKHNKTNWQLIHLWRSLRFFLNMPISSMKTIEVFLKHAHFIIGMFQKVKAHEFFFQTFVILETHMCTFALLHIHK